MRSYLASFFATLLGAIVLVLGLALGFGTFERLEGDLTRIGFYSERDFGWNARQPVLDLLEHPAQADGADILVLGDSFSERNAWQSVLAARLNQRIASYRYGADDCFEGFVEFALRHPSAKRVVIETVERNFAPRFGQATSCAGDVARPWRGAGGQTLAERAVWPPELHIKQTVQGALNVLKMQAMPDAVF
jgi:hypothetical protein